MAKRAKEARLRDLLFEFCGSLQFAAEERKLADNFETILRNDRTEYQREHDLGAGDRVDFFVNGNLAVEIKTNGSYTAVLQQLSRYAQHDQVRGVLLVTTRAEHKRMPPELANKPLIVYWVSPLQ